MKETIILNTSRMEPTKCPFCGYRMDSVTGGGLPKPGSLSICISCYSLSHFDETLQLAKLTAEQLAAIKSDKKLYKRIELFISSLKEVKKRNEN